MITRRITTMAAALAVLTLSLAACGGGAPSTPGPLDITIKAEDIKFDVNTIDAKVGQTINVTYTNVGVLEHTFLIDGMVTVQKVTPGQTINFSFTSASAGQFIYYCNVAGHREAGMLGTLNVTP